MKPNTWNQQIVTIENKGWAAQQAGQNESDCPYQGGYNKGGQFQRLRRQAWLRGYEMAAKEARIIHHLPAGLTRRALPSPPTRRPVMCQAHPHCREQHEQDKTPFQWADQQYSFGYPAGKYCEDCWKKSGYRDATDSDAEFDETYAGESLHGDDY